MENKRFLHQVLKTLDEAIPILEKWFDDIHAESEKLKKQAEENQTNVVQMNNKI